MEFELRHAVFAILPLRPQDEEAPRVYCDPAEQGSAFFISKDGLFLTARHVVNKWSADSYSVIAVHFGLKGQKACRVRELERHPDVDIAVGLAEEPGPSGWPHPFTLSGSRIGDGAAIVTFGYAKTRVSPQRGPDDPVNLDDKLTLDMLPRRYAGHVREYLPRAPLITGPCYHVSCDPGGGISGGPLIRKRTMSVHAIFTAGIPQHEEGGEETGFATDVGTILDDWQIPFLDGLTLRDYASKHPRRLSIR